MAKKKEVMVSDDQVKTSIADADLIKIDERAVLVYCSIGQWAATKKDKELTGEVTKGLDAKEGSFRVSKDLLPGAESLRKLQTILREFRTYHYDATTAYGRDGWALLKTTKIAEYKKKFLDAHAEYEISLREFLAEYNDLVEKAKLPAPVGLGKGWKQTDYPPSSAVEAKFRMDTDMRRIRESQNSLIGVSDEITKQIADEADARIRAGLESSVKSIIERITKVVGNVIDVCGDGTKVPRIHETLIDNVKDLATSLPDLNVTGDARYDRIADEMLKRLGKFTKDDLTGSDDAAVVARKEAATSAKEILDDLAGAF